MERRWLLFFILTFLVVQLFSLLMHLNEPSRPQGRGAMPAAATTATLSADGTSTAAVAAAAGSNTADSAEAAQATPTIRTIRDTTVTLAARPGEITTVTTQKFAIGFDSVGAVIHSWRILDPGSENFSPTPGSPGLELVRRIPHDTVDPLSGQPPAPGTLRPQTWPLEIGLREQDAVSYEEFNSVQWEIRRPTPPSPDTEVVQCVSPVLGGIQLVKTYTIPKNGYLLGLQVTVRNENATTIPVYDAQNRGLVLRWGPGLVERNLAEKSTGEEYYDGAVYRIADRIRLVQPGPDKPPVEIEGPISWAGVEAKFFAALFVTPQPPQGVARSPYFFRTLVPANHKARVENFQPPLTMELATSRFDLPPMSQRTFEFDLYVGPKKHKILKAAGHDLQALMFHSSWAFMRALYLLLTDLLNWIYGLVGNYGVAIILLTVLVRLIVFPLTQHSIRIQAKSMAEMAKVKPYIDQINEKYKNDPQEKNRRIWEVYKEHNISPFGALRGCVPMLLQLPIFFGLYRVSNDTIDLQGASFLWMRDLSLPDHLFAFGIHLPLLGAYFNLLPITMALTQMLATWVASARMKTMDPMQKQMMYIMPLMFVVMLYHMPAGLMIYWNASNIWQIFQTMLTNKQLEREEKAREMQAPPPPPVAPPPEQTKLQQVSRKKK
jgi:YidC/Oxa1 family membrane protein insertase